VKTPDVINDMILCMADQVIITTQGNKEGYRQNSMQARKQHSVQARIRM
jgi:hypothetical protein